MNFKLFFLFLVTFVVSLVESTDPIVQISNGKVQGKIMQTLENKTFYAFQGIPFAKPPIGNLRFQPPQPVDNWKGVLNDHNGPKMCIQQTTTKDPNETEDCLYIKVYTPQLPTKTEDELLPVVYFIHGGAFVFGSADYDQYGPHHFIDKNIVMVQVQYRLGFLGFLSTEDLICPGNNGLKDQQFGLKWVQKNIQHFGGDPKKVTIFGQSAGAASVGYHLIATNSKGLFRAAIQNSGSSLSSFALQENPKTFAYLVGNKMNSSLTEDNTTSQELIDFFKKVSIEEIRKKNVELFGGVFIEIFHTSIDGKLFSGVIEPEQDGAFLTQSAYEKFKSGNSNKVPTLLGFNSEEVLFLINDESFKDRIKKFDKNPDQLVPFNMHITDNSSLKKVGEKIRNIYVQDKSFSNHKGLGIKYFSDSAFCRSIMKQAELQSQNSDVYLYEFAYSGKLGYDPFPPAEVPEADSVYHSEDLKYLFYSKQSGDLKNYSKEDILTMNRLVTMWTNFVKYLNPTPENSDLLQNVTWPKITSTDNISYLLINDTLKVEFNPKKKMMDGYKILYDTYAIPPINTY